MFFAVRKLACFVKCSFTTHSRYGGSVTNHLSIFTLSNVIFHKWPTRHFLVTGGRWYMDYNVISLDFVLVLLVCRGRFCAWRQSTTWTYNFITGLLLGLYLVLSSGCMLWRFIINYSTVHVAEGCLQFSLSLFFDSPWVRLLFWYCYGLVTDSGRSLCLGVLFPERDRKETERKQKQKDRKENINWTNAQNEHIYKTLQPV